MFKNTLVGAALVLAAAAGMAPSAHAGVVGFTGAYDPGNWTTTLGGTPPGGGGPVGATNDGSTLTLTGGDGNGCESSAQSPPVPCQIVYGITIPGPEQDLLFHWAYSTNDLFGDPAFDAFGYIVDGIYTQLSDPAGIATQDGDVHLSLAGGSQFAWYIDCTDCIFGEATATITDFQATPEPTTLALVGCGIAAAAATRRRRCPAA